MHAVHDLAVDAAARRRLLRAGHATREQRDAHHGAPHGGVARGAVTRLVQITTAPHWELAEY